MWLFTRMGTGRWKVSISLTSCDPILLKQKNKNTNNCKLVKGVFRLMANSLCGWRRKEEEKKVGKRLRQRSKDKKDAVNRRERERLKSDVGTDTSPPDIFTLSASFCSLFLASVKQPHKAVIVEQRDPAGQPTSEMHKTLLHPSYSGWESSASPANGTNCPRRQNLCWVTVTPLCM